MRNLRKYQDYDDISDLLAIIVFEVRRQWTDRDNADEEPDVDVLINLLVALTNGNHVPPSIEIKVEHLKHHNPGPIAGSYLYCFTRVVLTDVEVDGISQGFVPTDQTD